MAVAWADVFYLVLGLLQVSQSDPAMGGANMKGIGPIEWTLSRT